MNQTTVTLRREEPADIPEVDSLIRDAFWNRYAPGASEHYLAHVLRGSPAFVPALDILAEADGRVIGSILYTRARILLDAGGELPVLSFGPIAVLPAYQGQGVGGRLILHTQAMAREMGERAILIYGDPDYYGRYGFVAAETFGIANEQNRYQAALLALELREGSLKDAAGRFAEDEAYAVDEAAAAAYDAKFPPREKEADNEAQRRFHQIAAVSRPRGEKQ